VLSEDDRLGLYVRDGFAASAGIEPTEIGEARHTGAEVYVRVGDLAAAIERLGAAGATPLSERREREWGDDAAYFADPEETSSRLRAGSSSGSNAYARGVSTPPYTTARVDVTRLPAGNAETDAVAVEEPLELRIGGRAVAVTMRTPGHDEELALGFCLSEGLAPLDARPAADLAANVIEVDAPGFDPERLARSFYTSSSCGVCGKGALEAIAVDAPRVESRLTVPAALVASLPERLREAQAAFAVTGGLHATGLFGEGGELLCLREDVGRHNAMDKVIGWAFRERLLPLERSVLCVSGRLSFELVQKAAVAGCPVLVAVGAPSSLAVELAADRGITLCGFVRDGRVNLYTEAWRIEP
jgi:FdhD protein